MTATAWEPARLTHARFAHVADLVARLASEREWPRVAALDECFRGELASVGMRLVEAAKTRRALGADGTIDPLSLYEVRICERGEIPTRPRNAHDLMNAIVWAAFPHAKLALSRALAAVQRERAAGRARLPATRTPAHDRLAMIDEGALLCVRPRAADRRECERSERERSLARGCPSTGRGARTTSRWIFGHAIYEATYAGELAVRAAPVDLAVPAIEELAPVAARAAVDRTFAAADLATAARGGPGIPIDDDVSGRSSA